MSRTLRHPASKGRADGTHASIRQAVEALGCPIADIHGAGDGVEDFLVGLRRREKRWSAGGTYLVEVFFWCVLEAKVARNRRGEATASQFTEAQKKWRALTERWTRIVATSGADAVRQIRQMTDSPEAVLDECRR